MVTASYTGLDDTIRILLFLLLHETTKFLFRLLLDFERAHGRIRNPVFKLYIWQVIDVNAFWCHEW